MSTFRELLDKAAKGPVDGVGPHDSPSSAWQKKRKVAPGAPARKDEPVTRCGGNTAKRLKLHETIEQAGTPTEALTDEHTTSDKALDKPDSVILTYCKRVESTRSKGPTPALQKLQFNLLIKTTNTSPQHGGLLNRFEEPDSTITSLQAGTLEYYDPARNERVQLTTDELHKPAYVGKKLVLESVWRTREGRIVDSTRCEYNNDKDHFTVKEVVQRIVDFERTDRPKSKWFGGIDCHHVYFEGMRLNCKRDAFRICWGS